MDWSLENLEERYPTVKWRTPAYIRLSQLGEGRFACRVCIANQKLNASDVPNLPHDRSEIERHIRDFHQSAGIDARRRYVGWGRAAGSGAPSSSPSPLFINPQRKVLS